MKPLASIITLLLVAGLALAAGSSGTTSETPGAAPTQAETTGEDIESTEEPPRSSVLDSDCENKATLQLRVKCRLVNQVENQGTPEACIGSAIDRDACITLYADGEDCYDLSGRARGSCFQEQAGMRGRSISVVAREDPQQVRDYIVFLLYDLEERVEGAYEREEIGSSVASNLVSQIIQIKKALLSGTSKTEVQLLMDRFKDQWAEEMP